MWRHVDKTWCETYIYKIFSFETIKQIFWSFSRIEGTKTIASKYLEWTGRTTSTADILPALLRDRFVSFGADQTNYRFVTIWGTLPTPIQFLEKNCELEKTTPRNTHIAANFRDFFSSPLDGISGNWISLVKYWLPTKAVSPNNYWTSYVLQKFLIAAKSFSFCLLFPPEKCVKWLGWALKSKLNPELNSKDAWDSQDFGTFPDKALAPDHLMKNSHHHEE